MEGTGSVIFGLLFLFVCIAALLFWLKGSDKRRKEKYRKLDEMEDFDSPFDFKDDRKIK